MGALDGKVVAIICSGSEPDREVAVALAEAGADIAIGTIAPTPEQEFPTASIANEIWAIGREQFNSVLDAADPAAAAAFAAEVADRLGRCDALVVLPAAQVRIDFDEISRDEWDAIVTGGLTAPLVAFHAFAPVIERDGGGALIIAVGSPAYDDVAATMVAEGLRGMAASLGVAWAERPLRALVVSRYGAAEQALSALS